MDGIEERASGTAAATMEVTTQAVTVQHGAALDEERLAWLALAMTPGLGPKRILEAVKETSANGASLNGLRPASRVLELPLTELEALNLPASAAQFIFEGKAPRLSGSGWQRKVRRL
jgi:DNA processing protein